MLDCLLALYLPHTAILFPHFIIILILSTLDAHLLHAWCNTVDEGVSLLLLLRVYGLSPSHAALIANVNLWFWAILVGNYLKWEYVCYNVSLWLKCWSQNTMGLKQCHPQHLVQLNLNLAFTGDVHINDFSVYTNMESTKTNNASPTISCEFFLNSIPRENVEVCVCIATPCIKWTDVCVAVFVYLLRSCCPQKLFWLPAMLWHKLLLKRMEVFLVLVYSSNTGQLRHRHHGFIRASHPSCWRDMKNRLVQDSLNCFLLRNRETARPCYSRCARERLRGQRRTSERFSFCITPPLSAVLVTPSAVWTAWKS